MRTAHIEEACKDGMSSTTNRNSRDSAREEKSNRALAQKLSHLLLHFVCHIPCSYGWSSDETAFIAFSDWTELIICVSGDLAYIN